MEAEEAGVRRQRGSTRIKRAVSENEVSATMDGTGAMKRTTQKKGRDVSASVFN